MFVIPMRKSVLWNSQDKSRYFFPLSQQPATADPSLTPRDRCDRPFLDISYLLTAWSRVLLEELTCSQLVNKFPAFYWTRKFITAFTSARHLSLSFASSIQPTPPHPTSWRSPSTTFHFPFPLLRSY